MTFKLPQNNIWQQLNKGDRFGDIERSLNLDLSNEQGKLKIAPRLVLNTSEADDAKLLTPFAIAFNTILDKWHIGAGADMFVGGDLPSESFAEDTATTPPTFTTTGSPDLAYFNGFTYGMAAELNKLNAGGTAWSVITSLTGSLNGNPLIPFGGRLYYKINKDKMGSINTSDTPIAPTNQFALDLQDLTHAINCGKASGNFIWLGTVAPEGQKARVHKWNGSSTSVTATYEIDAQGVLSIVIVNDTPWVLDSNGVLRMLNGGAFIEIEKLPYKTGQIIRSVSTGTPTEYLCHYNGMAVDREKILMNINSTLADGTTYKNVPSGVWEYNPTNKLFHRFSPTTTKSGGSIVDYGGQKVDAVGAVSVAKVGDSSTNGTLLAGIKFFTTATTKVNGIFYDDSNDTLQKAGIIGTSKIFSSNVTDIWQKTYARFRQFLNATDKIVIKARNIENASTEATITYVNTTSFTVPTASFSTAPVVGDEVEILQGVGAGRTAHITNVATSAPNYVITVDETITGATTQTAKARFETWVKLGSYNKQIDQFFKIPIQSNELGASPWIQLKVWFLWTGKNELYDLIISSKKNEIIE